MLVWVPPATFMLGQAANNFRLYSPNARTEHFEFPRREIEVTLTQGYFIGKFEVKVSQYRAYASETKTRLPSLYLNALYVLPVGMEAELETRHGEGVPFDPTGDHPMFSLTWNEAKRYCRWAGLRLPREAEWELAARGTDGRAFPWGNVPPDTTGTNFLNWLNTNDGEYYVAPVGRYPSGASPYGCMDMAGNVQEPVQDWIGAYPTGPLRDPTGPAKPGPVRKRVYRGGHYMILLPPGLHTAARWSRNPKSRGAGCGIRVALSHPKSE